MKRNIIIYSTMLFFGTIPFAKAQQQEDQKQTMGAGGVTIGYGFMDAAKMQAFVPATIGKFNNQHLLLGIEGHGMRGNFVMGVSGQGIIGDLIKTDSLNYNLGGGMGTLDFGCLILNKEKIKLFPMIGVGWGVYGIKITENKSVSVNEIKNRPGREIDIVSEGFLFDASVTINFIPTLNYDAKKNTYGGFMTGLKAGYIYRMPSSDWKFSGGDITGGPDFGLSMFYVKLIIGGLGFSATNGK